MGNNMGYRVTLTNEQRKQLWQTIYDAREDIKSKKITLDKLAHKLTRDLKFTVTHGHVRSAIQSGVLTTPIPQKFPYGDSKKSRFQGNGQPIFKTGSHPNGIDPKINPPLATIGFEQESLVDVLRRIKLDVDTVIRQLGVQG
jgi:hypothetical protein